MPLHAINLVDQFRITQCRVTALQGDTIGILRRMAFDSLQNAQRHYAALAQVGGAKRLTAITCGFSS